MLLSPRLLLTLAVLHGPPIMPSHAQTPSQARNAPVETRVTNAPVILGSDTLFFLHAQFAAVVIFPHPPGSSSDAFKGSSVFLGILVALGSSAAVSNMIAHAGCHS